MKKKINVTKIESEGGICPYQVEGRTDDDRPVYARYRHGTLYVEVGQPGAALTSLTSANRVGVDTAYRAAIGDLYDGYMTYSELRKHTKKVINWVDYPQAQENDQDGVL